MPSTGKHYTIEPLTDGVFAALAKHGGLAGSNAGIVDLGDQTLVFDTSVSPQAAAELVIHAERLTGRPPALVVNSHWHADHVLGNRVMPDTATIISTRETRRLIEARIPAWIEGRRERLPYTVQDLEAQLRTATEPDQRKELNEALSFFRTALDDLPLLGVRLPSLTFERCMALHGPARGAEIHTFGGGHTASDAVLWLPEEEVLFSGDLLFNDLHPWLGDGDPDEWLRILDAISALRPTPQIVVPGHGAVTTPDAFAKMRRYIPAIRKVAAEIAARGGTAETAAHTDIPAAFASWGGQETFANNMRWLFEMSAPTASGAQGD